MLDSSPEDEERKSENPEAEELYQYTLTQVDGTIYELSNINRTLTVDLNDLNVYAKVPLPDSSEDVSFSGYLFADNRFIIQNLLFFTGYDEDGNKGYDEQNTDDFTNFFAVVQSVADDNAEILLTDGKTTCTVPTYYCEDELYEGEQIMVTLDCDSTLFGNGEHKSFDYAVINTDSSAYNYGNLNFDTLAYATANKNEIGRYDYVTVDEVRK
jgi:hypothetical protein